MAATAEETAFHAGQVRRWRCRRARCGAIPRTASGFAAPADAAHLVPISVRLSMAPEVHRAKFRLDLAGIRYPWRWRQAAQLDDELSVIGSHPELDDVAMFAGHAAECDWRYDRDADCVVTAVGRAARLRADVQVYGRYMLCTDGEVRHFSGLRCEFNAGGRPNMRPGDALAYGEQFTGADGAPAGKLLFTFDGDTEAVFWTPWHAFVYLLWWYNADQEWLTNPALGAAFAADRQPAIASAEGLSLWEALASIGAECGYDVWESFSMAGGGAGVTSSIEIQKRGTGPTFTPRHQDAGAAGRAVLDVARTSLFAASVAENAAGAVACPIVLGARPIVQIGIALQQAWDPLMLAAQAEGMVYGREADHPDHPYVQKYVAGGERFPSYWDAGRLWDANTDGLYAELGLTTPDVAELAGEAAGTWPAIPYAPLPMIVRLASGGRPVEALLQWSLDAGATWQAFPGRWRLLADRVGVYVDEPNLAAVRWAGGTVAQNLFEALDAEPANVRMRLSCSIASPERAVAAPERRSTAGTGFLAGAAFDRGAAGAVRKVANSAWGLFDPQPEADLADEADELMRVARGIQDAAEDRAVEASLALEWPETGVGLGDRIDRIAGIEVPLAQNAGPASRYPRVIAIEYGLTEGQYDTQLTLETERKAGAL